MLDRIAAAAARPVSAASGAVFRIAFGLLAALSAIRTLAYGWVEPLYLAPERHFTYPGFGWVAPWPGVGMYLHFGALALLGLAIALGWRYRPAVALYLLGFTYAELIDATLYLNHYHWITLTSALMVAMPLHRRWSLDARRDPRVRADHLPAWTIWTLRAQLAVVYLFAGLAKLNPDWLLRAEPLATWLPLRDGLTVVGPALGAPATAFALSWAGAAFDLTIVAWLLWPRTRAIAYACVIAFHVGTWVLFPEIGIFPWLMIAGTTLFFPPDWPDRVAARLGRRPARMAAIPAGRALPTRRARPARAGAAGLLALAALEVVMPLRHLAYAGDVRWNEAGYRFSWRVMLTEKVGHASFLVRDPATGAEWRVAPESLLTPLQARMMATQADLILQTARWIAEDEAARGLPGVEVRAEVVVAMAGHPRRPLVDPTVDLASVDRALGTPSWVLARPQPGRMAPS